MNKPEWRNWQTRYVQGVVGITLVWVQIPPSALAQSLHHVGRDFVFPCMKNEAGVR
jgi:hypothetical protein